MAQPGSGAVANAGLVDLGESILVFDTSQTQQAARELWDVAFHHLKKPVSHVVNSHWHGDHIRGNQVFSGAAIIASQRTRQLMERHHPQRIADQRARMQSGELAAVIQDLDEALNLGEDNDGQRLSLRYQASFLRQLEKSLPTLELALPTETFNSWWGLAGSRRRIELREFGPGHTESDVVLDVSHQGICFVGDLVAVQSHMRVIDGDVDGWINTLTQLKTWEVNRLVPGHGPVTRTPDWNGIIGYLVEMQEVAGRLSREGRDPSQVSESDIPSRYRSWSDSSVYVDSLRHLMSQN